VGATHGVGSRTLVIPIKVVSGCRVDGERPLVALVREQERFSTTGGAKAILSGGEQGGANPASAVVGMDEQKEQLTVAWMGSGVSNDAVAVVLGNKQHVWRRVVGDELVPVLRPEHRLVNEIAKVGPADADGSVEYRPNRLRVSGNCGTYCDERGPRPVVGHETPSG
jgi:hypothetical protein